MATTCKLIAKQTLGSGAATVTFSNIPGTYTDLLLAVSARTDNAVVYQAVNIGFNGATTNRSSRVVYGAGSSVGSINYASDLVADFCCGANATASTFGNCEIAIPNYAGSTNKSVSSTWAPEVNSASTNILGATAGLWSSTAAITSITLDPVLGDFVSGSSFYLYGISKA